MEQLENHGFIKDRGNKREVFDLTKLGFEAVDQLSNVLILRRVDSLQKGELDYVDFETAIEEPFFGQRIKPTVAREKWNSLKSMEQLDFVPFDGRLGAVRLNDLSRKTLRENGTVEFSDPEAK